MDVDLQACVDGDPRAWRRFVDRCSPIIYAAVIRTTRGAAGSRDIDDPVQDVFVRLVKDDFRLLRTYDPNRASLSTWLTIVARSTAIDAQRRRRLETVPLMPQDEPVEHGGARDDPAPSVSIPLHLLTGRQRLVLRLLFDEGRSVGDAAAILGVDEQTVRSTKHKALSRLREHMA